jgi:hypothetical protein
MTPPSNECLRRLNFIATLVWLIGGIVNILLGLTKSNSPQIGLGLLMTVTALVIWFWMKPVANRNNFNKS